ncbi:carbohydrate ABC transporter permease [Paenibacillus mucilaginosus]|uniref:Sugar ABC transporter permease n=3 Tax=Paenibacillus mucilaginosus TaxID=61624 RepID=H6NP54_9BACL|nr:carbohydrate ABC transporter permease [Paenibacillus mucilaginosus]AEI43482.1 probable sugar ABC transporter, permease protein [Paenibacillus mucilaginosus KNP414]AFC31128.1 sugar ABC transporter permease [Paenibacillus mucilaginosus 3016]AFH63448.1 ABC transporter permease [Paenibacillus mucilaginosus K02]MCG7211971.1 carbohydrate ABC transporter permease [Paenibacillus mucilaginosus]WDM25039.1 carbohydrate ABC transporter permease [Paenibacillus mucilaginosus]
MLINSLRRTLLLLYAAVIIIPLYIVLVSAFKTPGTFFAKPLSWPSPFTVENFTTMFQSQPMWRYFANSAGVTLGTVLLELLLGSMIAYAIARLGGKLGKGLFLLYLAGLIVPSQVNMLPIYALVHRLGWTDEHGGLILVTAALLLPLTVFLLTGFMGLLSKEILEAASIDGAGEWTLYTRFALPLSAPSLAAAAAFLFVMVWNDLLLPMLLLNGKSKLTLPLAMLQFRGEYVTDYPMLLTGVVVTSLPMALLFIFLQRFFVAGMTAGSLKG